MPFNISRLVQLCEDVLGKDFTKLNSHLIYDREKDCDNDDSELWVKGEAKIK